MVLSNKKLKQRIRQDLVQSLSASVYESQSLKVLLDSASHKPRLSKREKRRNSETCGAREEDDQGVRESDVDNGGSSEKTDTKIIIIKKRKRDDSVEGELEGDEGTKEGDHNPQKQKQKQKNKKKKKKRKVNKAPKKAEEEDKVKVEEIQVNNTDNKEEEVVDGGVVPNKLYVGGIPYQSTEDEIRSYFRSSGVITKVDCKMRPEDGAFSGIAFITFETEDGAKRALAFDRAAMGDRFLTIQQYVKTSTPSIPRRKTSSGFAPEMVDGYNRVYIGNLAWDTTERDIRKLFSDCVITSVRLGKNKETGDFKGYAHVDFKDSVSVAIALKLDQHVISGRPVKICCALKERPAAVEETYAAAPDDLVPANEVDNGNYFATTVSSGKVKRRVCYECGEKGHLSTACPKKLQDGADDQANSKLGREEAVDGYALQKTSGDSYYYMNETYAATNEADNGSVVGKVKRRNCYECGEKGHLSTACPKKLQNTNSKLDHQAGPIQVTSNGGGTFMDETYATDPISVAAATNEADDVNLTSPVSTGKKVKRRNCYECGEKGHLSSACPKKLQKQG
ncbi:PREDICTED: RNA-binding protein 34-like isoform X2 [Camelina sativa]|uniref:RNA-binding protein 34-like isoform X2 n=1 Tax=Camelina sativa TaxID=90675 RepID=A0ABM0TJG3_CAMSA|nr:PREDICTED: RNA-binding protein 34-like isoform X2 [Camelina sativa]